MRFWCNQNWSFSSADLRGFTSWLSCPSVRFSRRDDLDPVRHFHVVQAGLSIENNLARFARIVITIKVGHRDFNCADQSCFPVFPFPCKRLRFVFHWSRSPVQFRPAWRVRSLDKSESAKVTPAVLKECWDTARSYATGVRSGSLEPKEITT